MHKPFIRDLAFKIVDGQRLETQYDIAAYYLARAILDNFSEVENYIRPTPREVISGLETSASRDDVKSALEPGSE